jgi:hypothetical protein
MFETIRCHCLSNFLAPVDIRAALSQVLFPPTALATALQGASGLPGNDRLAPRGSYNGTVVVRCAGRRLFIAPATVNATLIQRV